MRAFLVGWLVPALSGLSAALLAGVAMVALFGHHDPIAVSWHNLLALLAGFLVAAYVFGHNAPSGT